MHMAGRPISSWGPVAIFMLAFIYTAYVVDPEHAAETLQEQGGSIPEIEPGDPTADYVDRVVSLITMVGAVYLAAVLLIPEVLAQVFAVCRYL